MKTDKPILLVEDDVIDVLTVRRALGELEVDNELIVASNGEEGLELLRREPTPGPGMILLDLNMPRMNGLEFLRAVRHEGLARGVPIVVLTTSRQTRDIDEGFQHHVAGFMVKPVDYGDFVGLLQTIDHYWTLSEVPG